MRRIVVRFKDGGVHSFDLIEGREKDDLFYFLRFFQGKEVAQIEEQVYDPSSARRFRYLPRPDLEALVKPESQPEPQEKAQVRPLYPCAKSP